MKEGDLVISIHSRNWRGKGSSPLPMIVVAIHKTAKALIGVLAEGDIKYIHYKHLEIISEDW